MQARSRTIGFDLRRGGRILVLAPAIDMANHGECRGRTDVNCRVMLEESAQRQLVLEPVRPIVAGEELLIDYGHARSNFDLFIDYGFVVKGNRSDLVCNVNGACDRTDCHWVWMEVSMGRYCDLM